MINSGSLFSLPVQWNKLTLREVVDYLLNSNRSCKICKFPEIINPTSVSTKSTLVLGRHNLCLDNYINNVKFSYSRQALLASFDLPSCTLFIIWITLKNLVLNHIVIISCLSRTLHTKKSIAIAVVCQGSLVMCCKVPI